MAAHAAGWLERRHVLARTVTIKVRYSDFTTVTRSHTAPPTRDDGGCRRQGAPPADQDRCGNAGPSACSA